MKEKEYFLKRIVFKFTSSQREKIIIKKEIIKKTLSKLMNRVFVILHFGSFILQATFSWYL